MHKRVWVSFWNNITDMTSNNNNLTDYDRRRHLSQTKSDTSPAQNHVPSSRGPFALNLLCRCVWRGSLPRPLRLVHSHQSQQKNSTPPALSYGESIPLLQHPPPRILADLIRYPTAGALIATLQYQTLPITNPTSLTFRARVLPPPMSLFLQAVQPKSNHHPRHYPYPPNIGLDRKS